MSEKIKLSKDDIKDLKDSALKYRAVASAKPGVVEDTDLTGDSCGLCLRYHVSNCDGGDCSVCPVSVHSGDAGCRKTPYFYRDGAGGDTNLGMASMDFMTLDAKDRRAFRRQARKMADYMIKILDDAGVKHKLNQ